MTTTHKKISKTIRTNRPFLKVLTGGKVNCAHCSDKGGWMETVHDRETGTHGVWHECDCALVARFGPEPTDATGRILYPMGPLSQAAADDAFPW
jgi:hypothetical protein